MDSLIESYQDDLKNELATLKRPTVRSTPTLVERRVMLGYVRRVDELHQASNHLKFAARLNRAGKPSKVVRAVLKSAARCLNPANREQRETWTGNTTLHVVRKRTPKVFNDYNEEW